MHGLNNDIFPTLSNFFSEFSKWHQKGISIQPTMIPLEKCHDVFDVVFNDSTGWYNVCSNLSLDIYLRTIEESSKALVSLDSKNLNNFRYLFISDMNPYFQFDHLFQ